MLILNSITKSYQSGASTRQLFNELDLRVNRGEITALLGTSGSGKTTLLNLVSGIDTPDRGEIIVDHQALHLMPEPDKTLFRRQHIGFVFQFFNLIPTLTVSENIALPLELLHFSKSVINQKVQQLMAQVNIAHLAARYPDTLSGGEQQRTAIARALIHSPKLVLADEPTGNLDDETGQHIIQLLIALTRHHQTTMLIVTHSQSVAEASDRILTLRQGLLIET